MPVVGSPYIQNPPGTTVHLSFAQPAGIKDSGNWEKGNMRPGGNGIIVRRRCSQLLKN